MMYKAKVTVLRAIQNTQMQLNHYGEFLNVKPGGSLRNWQALKGYSVKYLYVILVWGAKVEGTTNRITV